MIAFAAERLVEIEVGRLTGAAHAEKSAAPAGAAQRLSRSRLGDAGRARSSCVSRSCARAATFRASRICRPGCVFGAREALPAT
jgi:hypothetical protein